MPDESNATQIVNREWRPKSSPWLIAVAVMVATFIEVLDTSVANVALPHIAGNLSASTDEATWVLTSYLVSNAIILPATGWFGRFFGRKRFLIVCILIFTVASALCGVAANLGMLIVARVLQGAGGGALQPISQAVLLESFPPAKRGQAMAFFTLGIVVAPALGPTLGGWITDNYSWRWIFFVNVPIGALAMVLCGIFLEDPPYIKNARPGRIDATGFVLLALWLSALQVMLDKGQEEDWFSSGFIRTLAFVAAVGGVMFVFWELRSPRPLVNLRVLANRNFGVGVFFVTVVGAVLYGSTATIPLFCENLLNYPALQSGMALSPRGIAAFFMSLLIGRLIGRVDSRFLMAAGFVILTYSCFRLGNVTTDVSFGVIVIPTILNGLAIAAIFVPLSTTAMGTLGQEQMGDATGLFNLMRNIGGAIGISGLTALITRSAQTHQALMVGHLTPYDQAFREHLAAVGGALNAQSGAYAAGQQAYGVVYQTLLHQASLWSYVDQFRLLGFVCLFCIPLVFLFKKASPHEGMPMVH